MKEYILKNGHVDLNHFIRFYEENKSKYIIIDEYNTEFTLDEFLREVNLK